MNDTNQTDPVANLAPPSGDSSGSNSISKSDCESTIESLLTQASRIFDKSKCKERELLKERIEIGNILLRLKEEVGHGNFLEQLKEWIDSKRLNFCYATAWRAKSYAELDSEGKLCTVQNLAGAEKVRRALKDLEDSKKEEDTANTAEADDATDEDPAEVLDPTQVKSRAKQIAKPTLELCQGFESKTRELLLEELIEIYTEELKKCE